MERLSVIIPVFNAANYIADAIGSAGSALRQSYPEVEVIVVNDGSTDLTAEAVEPFLDDIVYLEQTNQGPGAARNAGLGRATGDFIGFLDSDDRWVPSRAERLVEFLSSDPTAGAVTSDALLMFGSKVVPMSFYASGPIGCRFRARDQERWITRYNFVWTGVVARALLFEKQDSSMKD